MNGEDRAEYGLHVIKRLSKELMRIYGKGFIKTNLYSFYSFYKTYPEIFHSPSGKSPDMFLWTHYRCLMRVKDEEARSWYEKEAYEQAWSVRTLQRNIDSQYYYRLLASQNSEPVAREMQTITKPYQADRLEFIKNPVVAEFLGFSADESFTETDEDIARYSVMHGSEQPFASKYKLYPPTEEELRAEIESQKEIFALQQETDFIFGQLAIVRFCRIFLFAEKFFSTLCSAGSLYKYKGKQDEESGKGKGYDRGVYRKDDGTDV